VPQPGVESADGVVLEIWIYSMSVVAHTLEP